MAFSFANLGSGSSGNSTLVRCGRTSVLVDAGFSAREMARRLRLLGSAAEEIDAILITHEHVDHVAGAAVASRRWQVPVFCSAAVARRTGLDDRTTHGWQLLPEEPFQLGDLQVEAFPVPHDAEETVGFVLTGEGVRMAYATDMGQVTDTVRERLKNCHVLALEANHDIDLTRRGPYPWSLKQRILGHTGHLSNEAAGELLAEVVGAETRQIVLTHLSRTNNTPDLALITARAGLERSGNPVASLVAATQASPGVVKFF